MPNQSDKYHLAMSGEYFVAGQLHRLGVSAAVTYGNAKSADVVAFASASDRAVVVEVKSSRQGEWLVGSRVPKPSPQPWVLVHIPQDLTEGPEFYVLTQAELNALLMPAESAYMARYVAKHGIEYAADKRGVAKAKRAQLGPYLNKWSTITAMLEE